MSFNNDNLVSVGGHTGHAPGLFLYETTDTASTVQGDGYFDPAAERLDNDSIILAVQNTDTATSTVDAYHAEVTDAGDVSLTENTFA